MNVEALAVAIRERCPQLSEDDSLMWARESVRAIERYNEDPEATIAEAAASLGVPVPALAWNARAI